ncbi:MAG: Ig-like domain-containing protein [Candidatus Dormibacteria bacterium]
MNSPDPRADDAELFEGDPELVELAAMLRSAAPAIATPDPYFARRLRQRLIEEAGLRGSRRPGWRLGALPLQVPLLAAAAALLLVIGYQVLVARPGQVNLTLDSPLQGQQAVALARAIPLRFPVEMNHASVEKAVAITPATQVQDHWDGNTLYLEPQFGLAPGTDYRVVVSPGAATAGGAQLGNALVVSFSTAGDGSQAVTAQAPSQLSVDTASEAGVGFGIHPAWSGDGTRVFWLRSAGRARDLWSSAPDGSGAHRVAPGVEAFAPAPRDNLVAWVSLPAVIDAGPGQASPSSNVVQLPGVLRSPSETTPAPTPSVDQGSRYQVFTDDGAAPAVAYPGVDQPWIGWLGASELVGVRGDGVYSLRPSGTATRLVQADLAGATLVLQPTGRYLVAIRGVGAELRIDLAAAGGRYQWPAAPSGTPATPSATPATTTYLATWSPDGRTLAEGPVSTATGSAIMLTEPSGSNQRFIPAGDGQLDSIAFTPEGDQLLIARESHGSPTLSVSSLDGRDSRVISQEHPYMELSVSSTRHQLLYLNPWNVSRVLVADLSYGRLTAASRDLGDATAAVSAFLQSRVDGSADTARGFCTDRAVSAYSALPLGVTAPAGAMLRRFSIVAGQLLYDQALDAGGPELVDVTGNPDAEMRYVVRLFVDRRGMQSTVDETLIATRQNGLVRIDGVTQAPEHAASPAPLVTLMSVAQGVQVAGGTPSWQLQVEWDGDLDPATVNAAQLRLLDPSGNAVPVAVTWNRAQRQALLLFTAPEGDYQLQVSGGIRDVLGHAALPVGWAVSLRVR